MALYCIPCKLRHILDFRKKKEPEMKAMQNANPQRPKAIDPAEGLGLMVDSRVKLHKSIKKIQSPYNSD